MKIEMPTITNLSLFAYNFGLKIEMSSLWGKMPKVPKQKIENMSIFLALWMHLMVIIDNSSFFVIKHCTFKVL